MTTTAFGCAIPRVAKHTRKAPNFQVLKRRRFLLLYIKRGLILSNLIPSRSCQSCQAGKTAGANGRAIS